MLSSVYITQDFPNTTAILLAAGIGSRMRSLLPKQYCTIGNKTLIEYSINVLLCQSYIRECIVVINSRDRWFRDLPVSKDPRINIVIGGQTRADSVMAGLQSVQDSLWVLVHDAVRPCLHWQDLLSLFKITKFSQVGGILATPVTNTVKRTHSKNGIIRCTINRNNLWHALTPQLFNYEILKNCLKKVLKNRITVTDESSAVEYCGYKSVLVRGRSDNIKVTYQDDLRLVSLYLSKLYGKDNIFKI